jgi:hypothetical protein
LIDVRLALDDLARSRPLFHSEADFQHALAWEIHRRHPECLVRLEWPPPDWESGRVDMFFRMQDRSVAIELKYGTRALRCEVNGESFALKEGAHDTGKAGFYRDIQRLERLVLTERRADAGYAILLTNDWLYWQEPSHQATCAQFSTHEGRVVSSGVLKWAERTAESTKHECPEATIEGRYRLEWRPFSKPHPAKSAELRYLLVQIGGEVRQGCRA